MNITISHVPFDLNEREITRVLSDVLHSDGSIFRHKEAGHKPVNFRVSLNQNKTGGVRNDGTGTLILPSVELGNHFLRRVHNPRHVVVLKGKRLKFVAQHRPPPRHIVDELLKTPFINPDTEKERLSILWALKSRLRVDIVQFGYFYRDKYPTRPHHRLAPRVFSIEWELLCEQDNVAWLELDYDHQQIAIKIVNELKSKLGYSITIRFANIQIMGVGCDGRPYICFDTRHPASLEEIDFHSPTSQNANRRRRIGSLHAGHERVAPYARHLRVVLYKDQNIDMIEKFVSLCTIARMPPKIIFRCEGVQNHVETHRNALFTHTRLRHLRTAHAGLPWPIKFQLEALLCNGLLHTLEIMDLIRTVRVLCNTPTDTARTENILRRLVEALPARPPLESPDAVFRRILHDNVSIEENTPPNTFACRQITLTPTRTMLKGPYPGESNRIIRKYPGFEDHFLRVEFRDEDLSHYEEGREVDSSEFVKRRVGGILKQGFAVAGREYEFLGYSMSGLRNHALWFISPFELANGFLVTSEYIRLSIGDLTDLRSNPPKYAARLAQTFTSTAPSVMLNRNQWEEVDDMGEKPYFFTDGVGTISKGLAVKIYGALRGSGCVRQGFRRPDAYQIRFLSYKGMVAVDPLMDETRDGISMRLRPSMNKFPSHSIDEIKAEIEIVEAFDRPKHCFLNRPLIMILEELGVKADSFMKLQESAVADVKTISESSPCFRKLLDAHELGEGFNLSSVLTQIECIGLDLNPRDQQPGFDTIFLQQVREVATSTIMRDIKHSARIPIPGSYLLVGVADEGPAYSANEVDSFEIYTLPERHIYACVQGPNEEPVWLEGPCSVSRSPVAHSGDVQRAYAIGEPPAGKRCAFAGLKNVVVFPSIGSRSLASYLGGGDLDGDTFLVIMEPSLLPPTSVEPLEYAENEPFNLGRNCTIDDVCDFIVEYINLDVLGLLSDRLLVVADQREEDGDDQEWRTLAQLYSQAVDYPKQGTPVNIDYDTLPRTPIRRNPDWHRSESLTPSTDYYISTRALGHLYRSVEEAKTAIAPLLAVVNETAELLDPISARLRPQIQHYLANAHVPDTSSPELAQLFQGYVQELRYICSVHTSPQAMEHSELLEAEVVLGTILSRSCRKKERRNLIRRLGVHTSVLVASIRQALGASRNMEEIGHQGLMDALQTGWNAWAFSVQRLNEFGANSFGLLALGVIFECCERLFELHSTK